MKKILLLTLCLYVVSSNVNADMFYKRPYTNYSYRPHVHNRQIVQTRMNNLAQKNMLSNIERALFNREYNAENINMRLNRLETEMYGEPANGTISQRYNNLVQAFNYDNPSPYSNYAQNYSPETARKLSIVNKLANFLAGTSTEVTPELTDYGFDESYTTPYGFGYSRRNNGSGLGVRIMD